MTKKDYILLAKVISEFNFLATNRGEIETSAEFAKALGVELKKDNPAFDVTRFVNASIGL